MTPVLAVHTRRAAAKPASTINTKPVEQSGRVQQLDGLRGIAMLFVFFGHFATVWSPFMQPDNSAGAFLKVVDADATFGSSFFMLLSAFFAYGSMRRGKTRFGTFIRRRFWRIYPLYLVMTCLYIAGSLLIPKMSKLPADPGQAVIFIIETLLFLPGLLPGVQPMMDVAWTLSFLIPFYFVEAAFAAVFRSLRVPRIRRFALLCSIGILWGLTGDLLKCWEPRTMMFWAGMALWEAVEAMSGERREWAAKAVGPAALIVILGVWLRTRLMLSQPETPFVSIFGWRALITAVTLAAFMWVCYFGPKWWKNILSVPLLCKLGLCSYSFYLTHGIAIKMFRFGFVPALGDLARMQTVFWLSQGIGLCLALCIALVVYRFVEHPLSTLGSGARNASFTPVSATLDLNNQLVSATPYHQMARLSRPGV